MLDGSRRPATFLMTSNTAPGHFLRVLDLAKQLGDRGHRVLFKAKANTAAEVKAAGAELIPYDNVIDFQDIASHTPHADLPVWLPRFVLFPVILSMFQARNVVLAQELEPVLRREKVDCVVYDFFDFGAAWAAERAGIPWASAGNMGTTLTQDELPLMFKETPTIQPLTKIPALPRLVFNQLISLGGSRTKLGLPPYRGRTADLIHAMSSPHLHIVMAHRGLAGDAPLRENQVFVGPTAFNVGSSASKEPLQIEPNTVVVSTTTTGKDDGLFRRVLEAIAPLNVPVLGTAASADEVPAGLGAHVRIERYIPHDTVFPEARALITHGGWGTVGRALTHGLPMLVIPLFGDQILNATLVERAGLGRHLPLKKATPKAIREALQALLADDAIRARARRVSAEIKQIRDDQVAARALEDLALGGKPGTKGRAVSSSAAQPVA